jgi:hypothetical protein
MIEKHNGGIVGAFNVSSKQYASGAWLQEDQYYRRLIDRWPPEDPILPSIGYTAGGTQSSGAGVRLNIIDKFQLGDAQDTRLSIAATLGTARHDCVGVSSSTHGYICGGAV